MINVDFTSYDTRINNLIKLIDEYEQIIINLFDSLKNSCVDWQDSMSILFEQSINNDKNETYLYLSNINSKKEVIEYIYEQYSKIGKKITIDFQYKEKILREINDVCEKLKKITFKIDNIDEVEDSVKFALQKQKIKNVSKNMLAYQKKIYNLYSTLEDIEISIKKRINEIEVLEISEFLLLKNENTTKTSSGFIAKENLISDISKIKLYSELEHNCLKEIYSCYNYFYDKYNSDNKGVFLDKILNIPKNIEDIFVKRNEYSKILSNVITNYESTLASVNAIFDETQENSNI